MTEPSPFGDQWLTRVTTRMWVRTGWGRGPTPSKDRALDYSGSFGGGGACFSLEPLLWGVTTIVLPGPYPP